MIGKSEDNIKEGLTVEEILPFFIKYKLKLRVYDMFYKLIYSYDPPIADKNNKALYCMVKGDHVYTLNHDVNALAHKQQDTDSGYIIQASTNYIVNERIDDTY